MAISTRTIKNKIKSVRSIGKITKAMELVSGSKMKKAVDYANKAKLYADRADELLKRLAQTSGEVAHSLQESKQGSKTLVVVVGASRGLCGSFNTSLARELLAQFKNEPKTSIDYITLGRPAEQMVKRMKGNLIASFINISEHVHREELRGLFRLIFDNFMAGDYQKVVVVSNRFISPLVYRTETKQLLPFQPKLPAHNIAVETDITFEPSPADVVTTLVPLLVETILYTSILSSKAAEHSARMIAMKNASDSAKSLGEDLMLTFNHARQDSITRELSEIISGAEALAIS